MSRRASWIAALGVLMASGPARSDPPALSLSRSAPVDLVGEKLVYRVDWTPPWYLFFLPPMEAGQAELALEGNGEYQGRQALRITFRARSSGTLVRLSGVVVDDEFVYLSDPETYCTFTAVKRIREGKRKREVTAVYQPSGGSLHIREVDTAATPAVVRRDETVRSIPPCVKDLFSALYSVRRGQFAAGSRHAAVVADNAKVHEVEVRVIGSERVDTPQGSIDAWKLEAVALFGGLFRGGGQFHLWLGKDPRNTPVRFEARVKLGKVTGRLLRVEP